MMPADYRCHKDHLWVKPMGGDVVQVGITHYAQDSLGEVVYVDCPSVGAEIEQGVSFGIVESVKVVSDLVSPVSGSVLEVNALLSADPCCLNREPYGEGWLLKVRLADPGQLDALMTGADYERHVAGKDA